MNLQGSISPSSSCKMNNIHRSYDFNECTHDDIRNKFQSSEQFGRMKGIGQHMNDVSIAKSFENSQNTNRVGKFGSSEHSAIVSGFNKLMIKIPMKQDEPTWFPSENSPESDELDVAAALLSMSSMQPKLVIKTKLDSIQALKNPTYARSTNTSSNKPQSTAPLINRMRKSCQCCTKSKLRCIGDGISPCERCTLQGTMCIYLHQRKRGPAPRQPPKTAELVSTPSAAKRVNQDLEIASKDPSPAEKKRKASFSDFSEFSKFVLGNTVGNNRMETPQT